MGNNTIRQRSSYGKRRNKFTGKELDAETGLYYYGARYLDPKTSRWLSGDPALGEYFPVAPVNDEAKKRNQNLPGQGGVFNYVNLHAYHYAGNNPVKYVDPDGREGEEYDVEKMAEGLKEEPSPTEKQLPEELKKRLESGGWVDITGDVDTRNEAAKDLKEKVFDPRMKKYWFVTVTPVVEGDKVTVDRTESEGGNLRGENGKPLSGITVITKFNGSIFRVYHQGDDGSVDKKPYREYYDVDGDGRIDFVKGSLPRPRR